MKERYTVIHEIYPDYLLLFLKKGKITSYGESRELIEEFGLENLKNVNKIVIDNLDIVEKEVFENNQYDLFLSKLKLLCIVKSYKKGSEN